MIRAPCSDTRDTVESASDDATHCTSQNPLDVLRLLAWTWLVLHWVVGTSTTNGSIMTQVWLHEQWRYTQMLPSSNFRLVGKLTRLHLGHCFIQHPQGSESISSISASRASLSSRRKRSHRPNSPTTTSARTTPMMTRSLTFHLPFKVHSPYGQPAAGWIGLTTRVSINPTRLLLLFSKKYDYFLNKTVCHPNSTRETS